MRLLTTLLSLALCLAPATQAAAPLQIHNDTYVIGVSPFLDASVKDAVYRGLVRLIVSDLPLNSSLEVYDAFNLTTITKLSIPAAAVFKSPKTRANQFAGPIGDLKQFLARTNPKPAGIKTGFEAAIRLPQFCDFLAQIHSAESPSAKTPLLLLGSPLYQDVKEPDFSMVDGYFPSDGHLRATREQSVFGFNSEENSQPGWSIYWAYFGDPWMSDLHHEKVERFWTLYLERRDSQMAAFTGDLATALGAFSAQTHGPTAAAKGWTADPLQTKPEMLRVNRTIELADWLTGDAPSGGNPPPPSHFVGPVKIGIRWKDNIDLDLYAAPRADAETLFFQHTKSPEGYYFKDQRSSPGREYEYIEFETPVDIRQVRASVNFYAGACPGGPRGEVRIEFLNRIYTGDFTLAAPKGNQGRNGPSQTDYWTPLPIQEILRLPHAASAE